MNASGILVMLDGNGLGLYSPDPAYAFKASSLRAVCVGEMCISAISACPMFVLFKIIIIIILELFI